MGNLRRECWTLLLFLTAKEVATAEPCDEIVYPPDAIVEGASIGVWTQRWWQWTLSIPTDRSPGDCDPTDMPSCRIAVGNVIDGATAISCVVDGCPLADLDFHRQTSPVFDFTVPDKNIFNIPPPRNLSRPAEIGRIRIEPLAGWLSALPPLKPV
jgi:hypothetical protein